MMGSHGNWNVSYLWIDGRASPEQREVLEAIGRTGLPVPGSVAGERG